MRDGMRAEAPIGMFDSGIGGLTVAKALMERLPRESLHYVGDTAHMPYGDKSPERLREYAYGIAERLRREGCKALVVACNSASSNALEAVVEAAEGLPVIDVVHPMVAWAATHHAGGRLALIGTRATVQSDVYARLLRARGVEVTSLATPLLASAIEEGFQTARFRTPWSRPTSPTGGPTTRMHSFLRARITPLCSRTSVRNSRQAWRFSTRPPSFRLTWRKCSARVACFPPRPTRRFRVTGLR